MNAIISQIGAAFGAMDARRKVMLIVGVVAFAVVLSLFVRIVTTPTMALLYSGLDSTAASGVIEGLDRQGVQYEVRGDAIYVPTGVRDRVRISLAGEGLPAAGAAGYELLDNLSGFGTTAEMFDAAYWRAKEGELARTILASHRVIRARVHIAASNRRPFERETPVTASVTVSTSSGALTRQQAEAIRFLVASAVSGLALHNVAVIDQENGVILRSGAAEAEGAGGDDSTTLAADIQKRVTRMLEARVGPGAAIVEVSVDTARDSETIRERRLDPKSRVVIHTDSEESTDASAGGAEAVTVASNLADGDVEGSGDNSTRNASRNRNRVNYDVSEIVRETVRPAGALRRISVAVMVDGERATGPDGEVGWTPRSDAELDTLRALVESAVGFDEERGDRVTIRTMEFSERPELGEVAEAGVFNMLSANTMPLIQILTLAIVALLLGLFVVKPILSVGPPPALAGPGPVGAIGGQVGDGAAALGEGQVAPLDPAMVAAGGQTVIDQDGPPVDKVELLEAAIAEQTDNAVRLLGQWLDSGDPDQRRI